jgi:hypothetical protein
MARIGVDWARIEAVVDQGAAVVDLPATVEVREGASGPTGRYLVRLCERLFGP